jgi:sucrose phosphorylase
LLYPADTSDGTKYVWCTFSHDQMDLNFANPDVLLEFVHIVRFYLEQGVSVFRLDAVAFIWKEIGSKCINLRQAHEIVRLFRALVDHYDPRVLLITETNIPDRENLTYFGNGNEAHMVYNFPLPPLLLNTLWSGDCTALSRWIMSLPPAQDGTTYYNFIASHDGIGLRPVEELLGEEAQKALVKTAQKFGGHISSRVLNDKQLKPYEINISLFDAMSGTHKGKDEWGIERILCAHAIMMSLEGVPAFYIHSLLGTENDLQKLDRLGQSRAINRHNWVQEELEEKLANSESHHSILFKKMAQLISIRKRQTAFYPNAVQFTLQLGPGLFGVWRQSAGRKQSIFSISNVAAKQVPLSLGQINLISVSNWADLISGQEYSDRLSKIQLMPYQTVWISNADGDRQFL